MTVQVLDEGVHSGDASGVVPSSFRILRQLLDRVEDATTGRVLLDALHVDVPTDRLDEARRTAAELTHPLAEDYPFAGSTRAMVDDPVEQLLARTWRPTVSYVGADGFPPTGRAGNVLRPSTSLSLSVRLPPTCDPDAAASRARRGADARSAVGSHGHLPRQRRGTGMERADVRAVAAGGARRRVERRRSATRRGRSARAARSRSWACSGRCSPTPSS